MPKQNEAEEARIFTVRTDDAGRRLDRVLRKLLPGASLARIYAALRRGEARIDGQARAADYRVQLDEQINLRGSLAAASRIPPVRATRSGTRRDAEAWILHRSRDVVVFNKPCGLPVHGEDSLASAAEGLLSAAAETSLSFRPGPVHRLDKDTSGLVFFAVSLTGARVLSALLRDRACEKTYLALLEGELERDERWEDTLLRDEEQRRTVADPEGDASVAEASPLLRRAGLTLAQVRLVSGRTHQIRAQASLRGHPLLGDTRYGGRSSPSGYVLHAARFRLPAGTPLSERSVFTAPLPPASLAVLERHFGMEDTARAVSRIMGDLQTTGEP